MHKISDHLNEIILVGLTTRTNNKNEMDPQKAKIGGLLHKFTSNDMAKQIKNRKSPGVLYSVYTEYDNDEHGDYTYFIGEEVASLDNQDLSTFNKIKIPSSAYKKFTTPSGKIPDIVISAWQKIWNMSNHELEGERTYIADFEVYDQRAINPNNATIDIYIGIN